MRGHNLFYDSAKRVREKVVLAMAVDYLPGDILAYTDRDGWHNVFVKGEFYGRTKSLSEASRWAKQLYEWMTSDFYELKSRDAQREQAQNNEALAAQHQTLLILIEDAKAKVDKLEDDLSQLRHDNPFAKFLKDRKEN